MKETKSSAMVMVTAREISELKAVEYLYRILCTDFEQTYKSVIKCSNSVFAFNQIVIV
jgi:hypothetical protein